MPDRAAPTLDAEALAELAPFGEERTVAVGDVLYRAGDESYDFLVVLEGSVDIIRPDAEGDALITTHGAGRFLGELNMLTGQRLYLTARVSQPGRVLAVPAHEFRRVMSSKPELADTIFSAFVARRSSSAPVRARGRYGSSVPATRPTRWRCARSRPDLVSRTSGSTSRTKTTSTCCSPAWGFGRVTPRS